MRIAYVSHARFPTEKAHGHQMAEVCAALKSIGHTVTLIAPDVHTDIRTDPFRYYGISENFSVKRLPAFDALHSPFVPGALAFLFTMSSYRRALKAFLSEHSFDILYCRSVQVLPALFSSGQPVILELHDLPRRGRRSFVRSCNACARVVCLTSLMREELLTMGVSMQRVVVEGDAVDLRKFQGLPSIDESKHHFNLPEHRHVVGYIGSLVTRDNVEKGVAVLVDALVVAKKKGTPLFGWIVGGPRRFQEKYRKRATLKGLLPEDIRFDDLISSRRVPEAISACDVCVYPAPASKRAYFTRDTSPLKLFQYLASGKPVVCADLPPLQDVIDKSSVRLVHPGSAVSLYGGISDILEHPKEAKERAKKGLKIVAEHTWEKRMRRILEGL